MIPVATSFPIWLIPAFPALAAVLIFIFSSKIARPAAAALATAAVFASFITSVIGALLLASAPEGSYFQQTYWKWLDVGFVQSNAAMLFDRVSMLFALVVTGVGFLIHWYSTSYLHQDEGEKRYFGYLNLFVASMLVLVLADNAFFMFLGWEGVGACSFALIGHYYAKRENVSAALKAFFVTRLGDVFLMLGVLLCAYFATVQFTELPKLGVLDLSEIEPKFGVSIQTLILITGLLLLLGAAGKSAQLPLQTWLPDAMAGPTPVSALIHAATMVTAGVYLIVRFHPIFALSPTLMAAVAIIGLLTAFYGATCAIVQSDIKRILAFSTISQIGYMFLALGVGAYSLGLFHFFTHAFYKALLFLASGTIIHSLHGEQNVFKMGGLKRRMPGVYWATVAGAAALAGIPLTSGFFSKDAILWSSLTTPHGNILLYVVGLVTAGLTAIYSFRFIALVFHGQERGDLHFHAPGKRLTYPLYILAVFALIAGFLNIPGLLTWEHYFSTSFIEFQATASHNLTWELAAALLSGVIAIAGAFAAFRLFTPRNGAFTPALAMDPAAVEIATPAPYRAAWANYLYRAWDFDLLYATVITRPYKAVAGAVAWVDEHIVDGIAEAVGVLMQLLHGFFVTLQNGRLGRYAGAMLLGAVILITILVFEVAADGNL